MAADRERLISFATETAQRYGIRPELLVGLIESESGFDPEAVGDGGKAVGIAQFHPQTAEEYGVSDRNDPYQSIDAAAAFLADKIKQKGSEQAAVDAFKGTVKTPSQYNKVIELGSKILGIGSANADEITDEQYVEEVFFKPTSRVGSSRGNLDELTDEQYAEEVFFKPASGVASQPITQAQPEQSTTTSVEQVSQPNAAGQDVQRGPEATDEGFLSAFNRQYDQANIKLFDFLEKSYNMAAKAANEINEIGIGSIANAASGLVDFVDIPNHIANIGLKIIGSDKRITPLRATFDKALREAKQDLSQAGLKINQENPIAKVFGHTIEFYLTGLGLLSTAAKAARAKRLANPFLPLSEAENAANLMLKYPEKTLPTLVPQAAFRSLVETDSVASATRDLYSGFLTDTLGMDPNSKNTQLVADAIASVVNLTGELAAGAIGSNLVGFTEGLLGGKNLIKQDFDIARTNRAIESVAKRTARLKGGDALDLVNNLRDRVNNVIDAAKARGAEISPTLALTKVSEGTDDVAAFAKDLLSQMSLSARDAGVFSSMKTTIAKEYENLLRSIAGKVSADDALEIQRNFRKVLETAKDAHPETVLATLKAKMEADREMLLRTVSDPDDVSKNREIIIGLLKQGYRLISEQVSSMWQSLNLKNVNVNLENAANTIKSLKSQQDHVISGIIASRVNLGSLGLDDLNKVQAAPGSLVHAEVSKLRKALASIRDEKERYVVSRVLDSLEDDLMNALPDSGEFLAAKEATKVFRTAYRNQNIQRLMSFDPNKQLSSYENLVKSIGRKNLTGSETIRPFVDSLNSLNALTSTTGIQKNLLTFLKTKFGENLSSISDHAKLLVDDYVAGLVRTGKPAYEIKELIASRKGLIEEIAGKDYYEGLMKTLSAKEELSRKFDKMVQLTKEDIRALSNSLRNNPPNKSGTTLISPEIDILMNTRSGPLKNWIISTIKSKIPDSYRKEAVLHDFVARVNANGGIEPVLSDNKYMDTLEKLLSKEEIKRINKLKEVIPAAAMRLSPQPGTENVIEGTTIGEIAVRMAAANVGSIMSPANELQGGGMMSRFAKRMIEFIMRAPSNRFVVRALTEKPLFDLVTADTTNIDGIKKVRRALSLIHVPKDFDEEKLKNYNVSDLIGQQMAAGVQ